MSTRIDDLLRMAMSFGASDLHLRAGSFPVIRVTGELKPLTGVSRLTQDETLEMAFSMMSNRQKQHFKEAYEVDIGYGVSGLGRFRVNIFQQRNSIGIVARVISDSIRGFAELGMPPILNKIADETRGLVLVTGTTGSGKSTTLAAIVDYINQKRNCHIVTIEDPIEFLHKNKESFVTQREVDVDTRNFAEALRGSLRQDPDVILVGEMRDLETIETALVAAETGHLVLSTLHTLDASETLSRIITAFPPYQQKSIRIQLAGLLKAVVSQRLMKSAKGNSRIPAVEVLMSTPLIRDYILHDDKTQSIRDAIAAGTSQYGMQTFDQSLFYLYQSGLITLDEALRGTTNPDEFRLRLAGINTTSGIAKEEMERTSGVGNVSDLIVRN
ncbi:MAG TPA: type IV pilus twitching motility protein PilT [Pyrinomonadaceae bacterium]|nr:type IV pilus twitching motility protein PilT [Chloracidobacterium sp.]MBP9934693.1 type IV pilus twitching motility protein PilT [Pyrinomonadaceae bacterium]MBK7804601.1 type IV pilus twitching motility protein PilT [Chloracidobacterium sp.]MBK9769182.1 type IV pilus twitching motility protein PilT [Chloracidobacterium sp.]MBL0240521.1 type IV pilus twitching motility protein PilT [Chloracidobacterium sp.]